MSITIAANNPFIKHIMIKNALFVVDAFTGQPFSGNPAGVCILSEPRNEEWMQQVAFEMNLSETAFILKQDEGFSLRWFTPTIEVDICGHATLAGAHILWETGLLQENDIASFQTRSGILTAAKRESNIIMGFPAMYARPEEFSPELLNMFNIKPLYVGRFEEKLLIQVESEQIVRSLEPDFSRLKQLDERGVVITSISDSEDYDFVSRYFAPWVGVNEDPVTGSSHCCLATFWSKQLEKKELRAYQASPRGGSLTMKLDGDRVMLGGQAVTVLKGNLLV